MKRSIIIIVSLLIFALTAPLAGASEPIGVVASVHGKAKIYRAEDKSTEDLSFKSPVFLKDFIRTDNGTGIQVVVGYDTMLSIGPNALVSLSDKLEDFSPKAAKKKKKRKRKKKDVLDRKGLNIVVYGGSVRVAVNRSLLPRDDSGKVAEDVFVQTPQGWFELKEGKNNDIVVSMPPMKTGGAK
jgi:hypothetical protein